VARYGQNSHTARQLRTLVAKRHKLRLKVLMKEMKVEGGSVDNFGLLCQCFSQDEAGAYGTYCTSKWRDTMQNHINGIKAVERAERGISDYIVSFELLSVKRDYSLLWQELKKLDGIQKQATAWLIRGKENPKELKARLGAFMGGRDRLLVVPTNPKDWDGLRLMKGIESVPAQTTKTRARSATHSNRV